MKNLLSILASFSFFATPVLSLSVNLNSEESEVEEKVILKVEDIQNDLHQQLNNVFETVEEVINKINSNSVEDLTFIADLNNNNEDLLSYGYKSFNVKITIKDNSKKYKWENNDSSSVYLTFAVYVDGRNKIISNDIDNILKNQFKNKIYNSSFEAKKDILTSKLNQDVCILNIKEINKNDANLNEIYQIIYDLELSLNNDKKWDNESVLTKIMTITTKIDGRNKIDGKSISNQIELLLKDKVFLSEDEACLALESLKYDGKEYAQITNIKIKENQTRIKSDALTLQYDLKINDFIKNRWLDQNRENDTFSSEIELQVDNRSIIDFQQITNNINNQLNQQHFTSVSQAQSYINDQQLTNGIQIVNIVADKPNATYDDVIFAVEFALTDPNAYKWSDESITNKSNSFTTKVDNRSIIDFQQITNNINNQLNQQHFTSVSQAQSYINDQQLTNGIQIVNIVADKPNATYDDVIFAVEFALTDPNAYKWSDESITNKSNSFTTKVDARVSLSKDLTNLDLGYFTWNDSNAESVIKEQLIAKNSNVKLSEIEISNITNSSAIVNVITNSKIYFKETINIRLEKDVRVKLSSVLNIRDLGLITTTNKNINANIINAIKIKNSNVNTSEISLTQINVNNLQNASAKVNVKSNSKTYFNETFTINFKIEKKGLIYSSSSRIYIPEFEKLTNTSALAFLSKKINTIEWSDVEVIEIKQTSRRYDSAYQVYKIEGYITIRPKTDSLYYTQNTKGVNILMESW
ncbi:hypothetical protein EELLY_v1c07270 [Entomoplasma ellychniae]|uniref:Chitinase n=1 Tax=Entomoplasma ellychniae TaxID=2114 RepID=A0A8E2UAC5_9MOLU|nr:hypothetical protein [Entomoplasma ellychniae]PPE05039.1 hypothetical protein EELLY_v1c07270 [Entomoplasma ellychniae]